MTTLPVLILDNGAYEIKAGILGLHEEPVICPNSIARSRTEKKVYVGDEIEECRDLTGLGFRRPFERGMLVNWDAEKPVWDRLFSSLSVNPFESSLLVTEPYFNLPNIAETYDQMIFEEWEFSSYFRCTPAALIPYGGLFGETEGPPECMVVIDVGYSYTHVVPFCDGQIVWDHVKRIDVGGKLLTNHLKHLISFRQWDMMEQTQIVNAVREACCYSSMDYKSDLEACRLDARKNPVVQEYILPDFSPKSTSRTGYIRSGPNATSPANGHTNGPAVDEEQVLYMGNERFIGSELLFNPSDIGLNQSGLPETVAHVIGQLPEELRGLYWANIGVFGGLGNVENLGERLERDLRALCPTEYEIGIFEAYDPAAQPYFSALSLASSEAYLPTFPVSRADYLEHGSSICRRRFGGPAYNVSPPGFTSGEMNDDIDDDERERRYAMGLESKKGRGGKKKGPREEEEVTSGNWGGRRRRMGLGV